MQNTDMKKIGVITRIKIIADWEKNGQASSGCPYRSPSQNLDAGTARS